MFYSSIHSPRIQAWQGRLARMPRWAWIAVLVGVVLPLVILGLSLLAVAVVSGLVVLACVIAGAALAAGVRRLFRRHVDDGRRNVRVIVRSARVIDP